MIGPGTGVRVYVASGVTDMRKGITGPCRCGGTGAPAKSLLGRGLRLPWKKGRQSETFVLGSAGFLPVLQGSPAGPFSLAIAGRRGRSVDLGSARDAVGGH